MTILESFDTPERTVAAQQQVIEQLLRENQQLRVQQAKLLSCINEHEAKAREAEPDPTISEVMGEALVERQRKKAKGKVN